MMDSNPQLTNSYLYGRRKTCQWPGKKKETTTSLWDTEIQYLKIHRALKSQISEKESFKEKE